MSETEHKHLCILFGVERAIAVFIAQLWSNGLARVKRKSRIKHPKLWMLLNDNLGSTTLSSVADYMVELVFLWFSLCTTNYNTVHCRFGIV